MCTVQTILYRLYSVVYHIFLRNRLGTASFLAEV